MKRLFKHIFIAVLLTGLMTSCAFHSGMMTNSASLNDANFSYKQYVIGNASTTKIFGLGGLSKNALVAEAKKDILQNYPLKANQALANITVDFKISILAFVVVTKVTVTADIVEFTSKPLV